MQNILIGSSGSGKSYEANVFHILEAVKKGRLVITNLPLNLDAYGAIDPVFPALIELRKKPLPIRGKWTPTNEEGAFSVLPEDEWREPAEDARCFAGVWDYYSEWRHPVTKQGPLFVIDEAQNVIPYDGTQQAVKEWSALHRHWVCDVLWITQSYRKLCKDVTDNIQICYRVRKMSAWGKEDAYIRKVQDGCRGEVLNTSERKYDSAFYFLYRSHTQGVSASEMGADDVRVWWKHWTWIGAALCIGVAVIGLVFTLPAYFHSIKPAAKVSSAASAGKPPSSPGLSVSSASGAVSAPSGPAAMPSAPASEKRLDSQMLGGPLDGLGIHILGSIRNASKVLYSIALSQNGQFLKSLTDRDLVKMGYGFEPLSDLSARLSYGGKSRWLIPDAPTLGVGFASAPQGSGISVKSEPAPGPTPSSPAG